MNQQVKLSYDRLRRTPFVKLSALQWRIIAKVLTDSWVRAGRDRWERDEVRRVAWVRAVTRLVQRGVVVREKNEFGDFIKLALSEEALYCGAMRAWDRDEARGRSKGDSPAWAVIAAIKAEEHRRRYARRTGKRTDLDVTKLGRGTKEIGAVAAALKFLAQQREGDIDAQAIVDFLATPTFTKGVVRMHLDALKREGHYGRILAEVRSGNSA